MNAPSRVLKTIVASAAVLTLVACGGGSDDDAASSGSDTTKQHSFAGSYSLTSTKIKDTCGTSADKVLTGNQTIEQSGNTITVREDGLTMNGNVAADGNSFTATWQATDSGAKVNGNMVYAKTATSGQYSMTVNMTINYGHAVCNFTYQGTATRK